MSDNRASLLQTFVAHGDNVNCASIGTGSGRIMATGGDDRKVNVWAIGKPNAILSLSGHTSAVDSVQLDMREELVAAGSASGTLKLWDLEQAKTVRTLPGHKSNIRCISFHPYGEFIATGSQDTNVKIWDIRRKGCIQSYKGHTGVVNSVRFSPDGRWLASGSDDGTIKLWDLTQGRLLHTFDDHQGAVTSLQFHPSVFLLASGSADRTVKFWDVETFDSVSSSPPEASRVQSIAFDPQGTALYSAGQNCMHAYGWEPHVCLDTVSVGWSKVADVCAAAGNRLVGVNLQQTNATVWVVDLEKVNKDPAAVVASGVTDVPGGGVTRPVTSSSVEGNGAAARVLPAAKANRAATAAAAASSPSVSETKPVPPLDSPPEEVFARKPKLARDKGQARTAAASSAAAGVGAPTSASSASAASRPQRTGSGSGSRGRSSDGSAAAPPSSSGSGAGKQQRGGGLDFDAFVPKQQQQQQASPPFDAGGATISDSDVMREVQDGHLKVVAALSSRLKNLSRVRSHWVKGAQKLAIEQLVVLQDMSVTTDVLSVITAKPSLWTLDLAADLLPSFDGLLRSEYESYIINTCLAITQIIEGFGTVIQQSVGREPDVSHEDRHRKCSTCYDALHSLKDTVDSRVSRTSHAGKVGPALRKLQEKLSQF